MMLVELLDVWFLSLSNYNLFSKIRFSGIFRKPFYVEEGYKIDGLTGQCSVFVSGNKKWPLKNLKSMV